MSLQSCIPSTLKTLTIEAPTNNTRQASKDECFTTALLQDVGHPRHREGFRHPTCTPQTCRMRHSYHIQFYWIPRPGVTSSTVADITPCFRLKKTKLDLINCEDSLLQHMIFLVEGPTNRCHSAQRHSALDLTRTCCSTLYRFNCDPKPTPCASWRSVPCLVITCSGMKSLGREGWTASWKFHGVLCFFRANLHIFFMFKV